MVSTYSSKDGEFAKPFVEESFRVVRGGGRARVLYQRHLEQYWKINVCYRFVVITAYGHLQYHLLAVALLTLQLQIKWKNVVALSHIKVPLHGKSVQLILPRSKTSTERCEYEFIFYKLHQTQTILVY